jgi:hypothetical protein
MKRMKKNKQKWLRRRAVANRLENPLRGYVATAVFFDEADFAAPELYTIQEENDNVRQNCQHGMDSGYRS